MKIFAPAPNLCLSQPICCGEIRWWNPIFLLEPPGEAVLAKGEANEKLFEPLGLRWIWERSADPDVHQDAPGFSGWPLARLLGWSETWNGNNPTWRLAKVHHFVDDFEGGTFLAPQKTWFWWLIHCNPPKDTVDTIFWLPTIFFGSDFLFPLSLVQRDPRLANRPKVAINVAGSSLEALGCRSRVPLGSRLSGGLDGNNTYLPLILNTSQKPWFNRGFTHIWDDFVGV